MLVHILAGGLFRNKLTTCSHWAERLDIGSLLDNDMVWLGVIRNRLDDGTLRVGSVDATTLIY